MAANPKTLRVVAARMDGSSTRVIELEDLSGEGFAGGGGKYVIVHTGLVNGDRAVKRAYSLMPIAGRGTAEIAVKRIDGIGARAMYDLPPGVTRGYSGPWGKLTPEEGLAERTFLVATDTGITTALGLVERSRSASGAAPLGVLWLRAPSETFLDLRTVRARVEAAGARFAAAAIPEARTAGRAEAAHRHVDAFVVESGATHVIATGDGAVVHPLKERLPGSVGRVVDVRVECFFNNPERKSAPASA
jgi:ferredoxin-NADP reductase